MLRRLALLVILPLFLGLLLPALCFAAESTAEPTTGQAADAVLDPDIDEGHRLFAHEKYEEALEHYLKALERNKDDAELLYRITMAYLFLGNDEKSLFYLERAGAIDPTIERGKFFNVPSYSMSPTLIPGDEIFVDTIHYEYANVKRNDIILIKLEKYNDILAIERVVGIPGDVVERLSDGFKINNSSMFIVNDKFSTFLMGNKSNKITISDDNFFIADDNSTINNVDSRHYGFISRNEIVGKVTSIFYSSTIKDGNKVERNDRIRLKLE